MLPWQETEKSQKFTKSTTKQNLIQLTKAHKLKLKLKIKTGNIKIKAKYSKYY